MTTEKKEWARRVSGETGGDQTAARPTIREGRTVKMKALSGRSRLVAVIVVATCAAGVVSVPSAFAQTAQQKSAFFNACLEDVMTIPSLSKDTLSYFVDCCELAGGVATVQTDASGNPTGFSCMMVSDPAKVPQTNGLPIANLPTTLTNAGGVTTSTGASGGVSNAGTNGLFQIVFTNQIIP